MAERTFWRIVLTNPPSQQDFLSHIALGRPFLDPNSERMRQAQGISVFATEAQARRQARRYPFLGGWLAEVHIADEAPIVVERTHGRPGHHTLWGDPKLLLASVARIIAVESH